MLLVSVSVRGCGKGGVGLLQRLLRVKAYLAGQSSGLEQQLTQRGFGVLPCCDLPGQRFQLSGGGFDCYPGAAARRLLAWPGAH